MKPENNRKVIEDAVRQSWDEFTANHPNLAEQLDRERVVEHAAQSLLEDPSFVETLGRADLITNVISKVKDQIRRTVQVVVDSLK